MPTTTATTNGSIYEFTTATSPVVVVTHFCQPSYAGCGSISAHAPRALRFFPKKGRQTSFWRELLDSDLYAAVWRPRRGPPPPPPKLPSSKERVMASWSKSLRAFSAARR